LSLGGTSPYTSTKKIYKNEATQNHSKYKHTLPKHPRVTKPTQTHIHVFRQTRLKISVIKLHVANGGIILLILNLGTWMGAVRFMARRLYILEKRTGTHSTGGLVRPPR